jgi:methionine-S-sulfoxide reductase
VELAFQRQPGVVRTAVGYTQGARANPTYDAVCSGASGHTEAVQLTFDPAAISFGQLCDTFFSKIDATALNRQGNDVGACARPPACLRARGGAPHAPRLRLPRTRAPAVL